MSHTIEPAASGRSKCRGCGEAITKGELRFGERLPNPFADGDMTIWFHPDCAAYKRPEAFREASAQVAELLEPRRVETLLAAAEQGLAHHRLDRICGVERAPSGRARCRHCRETIDKTLWRIPLAFFEEGTFNRSGYVHVACAAAYFETDDLMPRIDHFAPALADAERTEIAGLVKP